MTARRIPAAAARWAVAGFSAALVVLAVPAMSAAGLDTNDDRFCLAVGLPLFAAAGGVAAFPSRRIRPALAVGAFLGAWCLQAWALSWIEGRSLGEVFTSLANPALTAWGVVFVAAPLVSCGLLALEGRRGPYDVA